MEKLIIRMLVVFSLTSLVACNGCGGSALPSAPAATAPTISDFTASAATITLGSSLELNAVFANGTGSIDNGVGAIASGTPLSVTPTATTTYLLSVTNTDDVSVNASVTVTVVPAATIASFVASTATITVGVDASLTAIFSDGTASVSNSFDNSVGEITTGTPVSVTPALTTTYILIVTNLAGVSTTSSVALRVPKARYAFIANNDNDIIASYAVNSSTGQLKLVGKATAGTIPVSLASTPQGNMSMPQTRAAATSRNIQLTLMAAWHP